MNPTFKSLNIINIIKMKTMTQFHWARAAMMLLLVLLGSVGAWAQDDNLRRVHPPLLGKE